MKKILSILLLLISFQLNAQVSTLYGNNKLYIWDAVTGSNLVTDTDVFLYGSFTKTKVPKDSLDDFGNGDVRAGTTSASKYIVVITATAEEIIQNGDFSEGEAYWTLGNDNDSVYIANGYLYAQVQRGANSTAFYDNPSVSEPIANWYSDIYDSVRLRADVNILYQDASGQSYPNERLSFTITALNEQELTYYYPVGVGTYQTDTTISMSTITTKWRFFGGMNRAWTAGIARWTVDNVSLIGYLITPTKDSTRALARSISLDDLIEDTVYTYYTSVLQPNGRYSKGADSTFRTPLLSPLLTSVTPITGGLIVNWDDVSATATEFTIDTCRTLNGTYGNYSTVLADVGTDTLTGLDAYETYYIKIKSKRSTFYSAYSNTGGGAPLASAPSDLEAVGDNYKTSLSWTANGNNNFIVYRSDAYNGDYTALDTLTEVAYIDTPLTENTIWYYKTLGFVDGNVTGYTNIDSALVTKLVNPANAPTNFTATGNFQSISTTWTDASNNETVFRIYAGTDSASAVKIDSVSANTTSYCYTGLADSTIKYMYVAAINADGVAKSNSDSAITNYLYLADSTTEITAGGYANATYSNTGGNLTSWTQTKDGGDTSYVVGTNGNPDSCWYFDFDGTGEILYRTYDNADTDTLWVSFDVYISDGFVLDNGGLAYIFGLFGTGGNNALYFIGRENTALAIDGWRVTGAGVTTVSTTNGFAVNTWKKIQIGYFGGGAGTGQVKVYVDNTLITNQTSLTLTYPDILTIRAGNHSTSNAVAFPDSAFFRFDNIVWGVDSASCIATAGDTTTVYVYDRDSVSCSAGAGSPLLTVSSTSYNYGIKEKADVNYNASFIVTNEGTANATITSVSGLATPFSVSALIPTLPMTLSPSQSVEFNTLFNVNRDAGTFTDTLVIQGSDTFNIAITGQVQVSTPYVPPTSVGLEDTMTVAKLQALCSGDVFILDKDHVNSSDANVGTSENAPLKTWDAALAKLGAGDGLLIKKSVTPYIPTATQTTFSVSGTSATGGRIIIRGQYKNDKPTIDFGNTKSISTSGSYYTMECLYLYRLLQHFTTGNYVYFRGNKVYGAGSGNGQEAIRFRGNYGIAEYNEISNMGRNGINIYPPNGQRLVGTIIRYNYIHDNMAHHGLNIFPYTSSSGMDCNPQYIDSLWIYGNRFENNLTGMYTRVMKNFKIFNNIFANNSQGAILLEGDTDANLACVPDTIQYGTYRANGVIMNNTIYNSHGTSWQPAIENRVCDSLIVINNVIWESLNSSGNVIRFSNPFVSTPPSPFNHHPTLYHKMDYNLIQEGTIYWGTSTQSLSTWFTATSQTHSADVVSVDISITGTDSRWGISGNYIPNVGSVVIGAGNLTLFETYVGTGYLDYYGNAMGDDVGAVQYVP